MISNKLRRDKQCPECGRFDNRGISVDAVIVKKKKVLLIKRGVNPFKDYWATPGGYVGWDETVEDAVRREVKEETSLDVIRINLIGVYSSPKRHPKQVINIAYFVKVKGSEKKGDDATELKWFKLRSLPEDMAFDHKQNIMDSLHILKK